MSLNRLTSFYFVRDRQVVRDRDRRVKVRKACPKGKILHNKINYNFILFQVIPSMNLVSHNVGILGVD